MVIGIVIPACPPMVGAGGNPERPDEARIKKKMWKISNEFERMNSTFRKDAKI